MHRRHLLSLASGAFAGLTAGTRAAETPALPREALARAPIGLGTWLTFDVGDDHAEKALRREVLLRFLAAGGGMVDSSPMYGRAEALLGELLPGLTQRERVIAATKVWTPLEAMGPGQLAHSLRLWGLPRFDVLLVHNLLNWRAHLKTLRRWKDAGRVRWIGVSTSHGRAHDEVEQLLRNEPLDVLQITYNLADARAEPLLHLAAERGLAVVINRPYDGGRLFTHVGQHAPPGWAAEAGCPDWPAFFLKWIVAHPAVSCAIPATTQPAHLDQNMAARLGTRPDASQRQRMSALIRAL